MKRIISFILLMVFIITICIPSTAFSAYAVSETGISCKKSSRLLYENADLYSTFAEVDILGEEQADTDNRSADAPHGQIAPLNSEYLEYIESGGSGQIPSSLDLSYLSESYLRQSRRRNSILPASYDLRDIGKVSPVINQWIYGICWAIGTMGSAESGLIEQFPDISLSSFHLAWFSYIGNEEHEFLECIGWGDSSPFFNGGNDNMAVASMAAWKGPVYSETAPLGVENIDESLRYEADYHLQDAFYLPDSMVKFNVKSSAEYAQIPTVKQIILENGAVGIGYFDEDEYYNEENCAYYCDEIFRGNHEVLIVGWDDRYPKENFNADCHPENDGAWLIRNSWGTEWGDDGYFWLSYEDKNVDYSPYYNLESKDNYAKNYQYDTAGWGTSVSADEFINPDKASKTGYMSNIFTAESNEQLEAVSFYTTDAGTEYEISVYTGVSADKPISGKLAYSGQSGVEPYAGYHTIELNDAVKLKAGEKFSVVVKLKNPSYPYAIPVEFCILPWEKKAPDYMGCGGESYYSADGESWADVTNMCDIMDTENRVYVTNVCLKAFTNPLPDSDEAVSNIRFSILEGPVADGSTLELEGAEEIYYTVNGEEPQLYNANAPITLDVDSGDCTVTSWGQKSGKSGNAVSKTYTKAFSKLTELDIEHADSLFRCDLSQDDTNFTIALDYETESVKIRPRGADTITVNGQPVFSDDWSCEISVSVGEETIVDVVSSADGKYPTTYTLKLYRREISFDYRAETVLYDDSVYILKDAAENIIPSGSSVTAYIGTDLQLTDLEGNFLHTESVPARSSTVASPIDFEKEQTLLKYGSWNKIADNPEMENAVQWTSGNIPVEPGQVLYIQKDATDTAFACEPVRIDIPESRPGKPYAELEYVAPTYIALTDIEGAQYRISPKGKWKYNCEFTGLKPDTEYTFEIRIAPTDGSFASEILSLRVTTPSGTAVSVSYRYKSEEYLRYDEDVYPGENTVSAYEELLSEFGFKLENPENNAVTVNVTVQDGIYTADPKTVVFDMVPDVDPATVFFEISYWDKDGNRIPGDGKQSFDKDFKMAREDIVLPEGYQLLAVEEPDENWLYPVTLCYFNGAWRPYPNKVQLQIERMASVTVLFKLEDGTVISENTLYYGESESTEHVTAPAGYAIVGDNTFDLSVTRDENENLTANVSEVSFTVIADVNPEDYFFTVKYEDAAGNPVPGGGKQYFETVGKVSRESIPIPDGYLQVIPSHTGDEWLYPTELICVDGVWQASNPEVIITVEKPVCVVVVFITDAGTVLGEFGYELTYVTEGTEQIEITPPQGYGITGNDKFTVRISRNTYGNLTTDPDKIIITVKKNGDESSEKPLEPSNPELPVKPGNLVGTEPTQNDDKPEISGNVNEDMLSPQTGDDGNNALWIVLLLVSLTALVSISAYQKKEKSRD